MKLAGALTSEKLIRFGKAGGYEQVVGEMSFAGAKIKETKKNQEVGIKTKGKIKEKDVVFVIAELTVDREKKLAAEAKEKEAKNK